jgi:hypothetical protein
MINKTGNDAYIQRLSGNMEIQNGPYLEYYVDNISKKQIEKLYAEAIQIDYSKDCYVERHLLQESYSQ